MTPAGMVEVWIVDPLGRLPASLELELSKRRVAARVIRVADDASAALRSDEPPAGVLFADVGLPGSNMLAGFLAGLAIRGRGHNGIMRVGVAGIQRAMVWWGWKIGPAPRWPIKLRPLLPTSGPALAKVIAFQARKHRASRLNAASVTPP